MDCQTFYAAIDKPFFAPEPWVFGFAWGIIYPLIGVALVYALYATYQKRTVPQWTLAVFAVNLVANLAFTPLQLGYPTQLWATFDIFVVLGTLSVLQYQFWKCEKLVFILLLPYLLWGAFASLLQVTIYVLNYL